MKLSIRGIEFYYNSHKVLKDVSFEVKEGEVLALVGPNGSGKSTLLKCINKILRPQKGTVLLDGKNIESFGNKDIGKLIGYVPQSVYHTFSLTVFEMVLLGRKPYVTWKVRERDKRVVWEVLTVMGLDKIYDRSFNELSGGEKQKVLIAMALAQEPEVLLLDEPTSNLDLKYQLEVAELIFKLVKKQKISAIFATHDLNIAGRFSDKVAFLKEGKIFAIGSPWKVFSPEIIKEVYGVQAKVLIQAEVKKPLVIPISSCQQ